MTRAAAALIALAIALAGCAIPYSGTARPIVSTSTAGDGWIAAPAPVIRQRAENDCGPAALAMVAARWRRPIALDALARASAPTAEGTRLGTLRDLARGHGLRAFTLAGDRALLEHELARGRPVIVGLIRPHGPRHARTHFEVVVAIHADGRIATVDPGAGWQVRPWSGLEGEWAPAGHPAMVILGDGR